MKRLLNTQFIAALIIGLFSCGYIQESQALSATHYSNQSVLSDGRWVKISTTEKGVHCIDAATLSSWGFDDASNVSIYGKDGYMLSETFSEEDIDDLTPIPSYVEDGALYFYASGSTRWERKDNNTWKHTNNYYSNISYYFLTSDKEPMPITLMENTFNSGDAMTTYDEYTVHEKENNCIGQTGRLYLGEDLLTTNTVTVTLPGVEGDNVTAHIALGGKSSYAFTAKAVANGTALSPNISVSASDSYTFLKMAEGSFNIAANEEIAFTFTATGTSIDNFYLDYIRLFYTRTLSLEDTQLHFRRNNIDGDYFSIELNNHNSNNIKVWDITDVNNPIALATTTQDANIAFSPADKTTYREYVAFDTDDELLKPQFVCNVEPQNIHGVDYIPDMVIITTRYFMKEADRLAQIHRDNDNMKVLVCDQLTIFNEFSGGTPDATAIRRMMKMFYDRANAGYGNAPRYLLLYGRSSYNNRNIAPNLHNEDNRLLVTYQSESSTDERYSYVTDDYFGILDDNSGVDITSEYISLGIGRIPVKNIEESQKVYRKIITYINQKPTSNLWKNKACFIALNGDNNMHVSQTNRVAKETIEVNQEHMIINKVYLGAYNSTDTKAFDGAQEQIFRDLEEGCMIYDYMGHAGHISLGNNLIGITHAKSMTNQYWPIFITATCDVCPFDKDENSVGEELFRNDKGGFIGLFTTSRTVYTDGNEDINRELLNEFFTPEADGKIRMGDIMRRAKENLLYDSNNSIKSDPNKLKYCLIGDPALAIPLPTYDISIENINDININNNYAQVNAQANSNVTISGTIYDTNGEPATQFNGTLCYEVYDSESEYASVEYIQTSTSVIPIKENFSMRQYKLVTAADTIINGKFTANFNLPEQYTQNNKALLISLYAYNDSKDIEAAGFNKSIVINGIDQSKQDDTAPSFSHVWVGDESFIDGGVVESNTIFHCEVSDNESGLTSNEIMIGKTMTLWLNGKIICNDLSGYFNPTESNKRGTIEYPLTDLPVGSHRVTVKVSDNAGNSSEITVGMVVLDTDDTVYALSIEEDPVIEQASISLSGVVANGMNIRYVVAERTSGRVVWSVSTTATNVVVNIDDANIQQGEYIAYAIISNENGYYNTQSKKFVVLGQ